MSKTDTQEKTSGSSRPLDEALTKSKEVSEEIKETAEELGVVHAVLDTQLPDNPTHEDVEEAVTRAQELEKRLNASAEKLDAAAEILEKHAAKA
jgi:hypothetical protein